MHKEYSRRQLEQQGEPFGASCTQMVAGRRIYGGGGSSSSSASSNTTNNTDKRIAVDKGIGISSDSSTINVQALDGDIVKNALDALISGKTVDAGSVNRALDTVSANNAIAGEGFSKLLNLAGDLFAGAGNVIEKNQDTALAQIASINAAAADQKGTIDQKTIMVLAIAGAAAIALGKR